MSNKTKVNALGYLLKTWATAIPRVFYLSTVGLLFDPKGSQRLIHQVLNAQDIVSNDPVLASVEITELLGMHRVNVQIEGPYYIKTGSETRLLTEIASLAYIMRVLKPKLIFEIGTYVGSTTRLLALNTPPTSQILTLDLPQHLVKHKIGKEFHGTPEKERITQLHGNSKTFDFGPWYNKCDFVWVDACHAYEHVVSDSQNALNLCRIGGWIAWHDYRHTAWWSGVTRCVRGIHKSQPKLVHLQGTTIAVLPGKDV
ncbi:MAG: class I SAM-dependent methyltransferase [Candidatus Hodarchaeota archaeon]